MTEQPQAAPEAPVTYHTDDEVAGLMSQFIQQPAQRDEKGRFLSKNPQQPEQPEQTEQPQDQQADQEQPEQKQEQEAEGEQEEPEKFTIKVQDEEIQVTLDEALKGYMRQRDYTQKTQEIAKQRNETQRELNAKLEEARKSYLVGLNVLQKALVQAIQPELGNVNWQQLAQDNPQEYVKLSARAQQVNQLLNAVAQAQKAEESKADEERGKTRQQRLEEGYKQLTQDIPNWSDDLGKALFERGQKTYGLSTQEDGEPLENPKWVKILHDAHQYQLLKDNKPIVEKKIAAAQQTMKPNARPQRGDPKVERVKAAEANLKKSGSVDAFADYLHATGVK